MGVLKEQMKGLLRSVGLYDPVCKLWMHRPELRILCWNLGYRLARASDGLPIPPACLVEAVTYTKELSWYLNSGKLAQEGILYVLQRSGIRIEEFKAILDFGCGCGRIMRYWKSLQGPKIYGTDYNPHLIAWCRRNLNFAEFVTNSLTPPLEYAVGQFDFIYALSVFTHLTEELQHAWMKELKRVLKPGGFLLITVHGDSRLYQLTPEEQQRFWSGQLVLKQEAAVGTNVCGAYHPEQYVRENLAKAFEVVDFIPVGARDANQDVYLLRRSPNRQGVEDV